MKKLFSTLMVMACLVLAIPAQAQIKFGVKGGLNISKMYISKDVMKSDNRSGFFIGPTAEFTLPLLGLGVDVSALYNQYGAKAEGETATRKTIEIPVNLNWTIGFSSIIGGYLAVGPQFGFNVGAGLKLLGHLKVGANYNFALKDNGEIHMDGGKPIGFKHNTWQISAAYLF